MAAAATATWLAPSDILVFLIVSSPEASDLAHKVAHSVPAYCGLSVGPAPARAKERAPCIIGIHCDPEQLAPVVVGGADKRFAHRFRLLLNCGAPRIDADCGDVSVYITIPRGLPASTHSWIASTVADELRRMAPRYLV